MATSGHGGELHLKPEGQGGFEPNILFRLFVDEREEGVPETANMPVTIGQTVSIEFEEPGGGVGAPSIYSIVKDPNETIRPVPDPGAVLTVFYDSAKMPHPLGHQMDHPLFSLDLSSQLAASSATRGRCSISEPGATEPSDIIDFAVFRVPGDTETFEIKSMNGGAGSKAAVKIETDGLETGYIAIILYNLPTEATAFVDESDNPVSLIDCYAHIAYAKPVPNQSDPNLQSTDSLAWSDKLDSLTINFDRLVQIMTSALPTSDGFNPDNGPFPLYRSSLRVKKSQSVYVPWKDSEFREIDESNNDTFILDTTHKPSGVSDYPSGMYMLGKVEEPEVAASSQMQPALVNLNNAPAAELIDLPGIGEVYAQQIIEHRTYGTIEEIMNVPGIGPKTFTELKHLIMV